MRAALAFVLFLFAAPAWAEEDIVAIQAEVLVQMEALGIAPEDAPTPRLVSASEMEWVAEKHASVNGPTGAAAAQTVCVRRDPQEVMYAREWDGQEIPWGRLRAIVAYEIHRSAQCEEGRLNAASDWRGLMLEGWSIARRWAEAYDPGQLPLIDQMAAAVEAY